MERKSRMNICAFMKTSFLKKKLAICANALKRVRAQHNPMMLMKQPWKNGLETPFVTVIDKFN